MTRSLLHRILGGDRPPLWLGEVETPMMKAELVTTPKSPAKNPSGDGDEHYRGADYDPLEENRFFVGDKPNMGHPGANWLSFETLRYLSDRSVCAPFKSKRHQHFLEFQRRPKDEFDVGFTLGMRDPEAKVTPGAKKDFEKVWKSLNRDEHFYDTMGLVGDDSLTYDWGVWETRYERGGRPHGFRALDAKTVRRGRPRQQAGGPYNWVSDSYVQVMPSLDRVINVWHKDEIGEVVRRRRTGLEYFNYGHPETQQAFEAISAFLEIDDYNQYYFRNGMHASGILQVIANMTPKVWQAFRQVMTAQTKGVNNINRLAMMLLSPGSSEATRERLELLETTHNNNDMQFSDMWLIKVMIVAANYNMRPAEAGLPEYKGSGTPLGSSNTTEEVRQSRLYGVKPMLNAFESALNEKFVWRWEPDFMGRYVTDVEDEKTRLERIEKRLQMGTDSLNEGRKRLNQEPIDRAYFKSRKIVVKDQATMDAWIAAYSLPLNQNILQAVGNLSPMPPEMGGPGGPGEEGGDPGAEGGGDGGEQGMEDGQDGIDEQDEPAGIGAIDFKGNGPFPGQQAQA